MNIREVIATIHQMQTDGIVERYAIGGAVGATFYLEPVSTLDVDVFVALRPSSGNLLVSLSPILDYLKARGCAMQGEYIIISGWPVQFLAPSGPLVEEALSQSVEKDVEGCPVSVFSAEYLAAIALQVGRAKDKARLLQFIEEGVLDMQRFRAIVARHDLRGAWKKFAAQFLENAP